MKKIPQLDCVRAVAILAVFLHHALGIKLLWMGVDLFFVLSGFLITGVLMKAKDLPLRGFLVEFYKKRLRRIFAPYIVTLALVALIFGVGWMRHWYLYILLTNLLLPLHIFHPLAFEPLWSLAVEEQFYLAWPFAVYFLDERHLRWLSIFLIALAPILRASLHFQEPWPIYTLTPFRMDLLAAGAFLWLEWARRRERIERYGMRIGVSLVIAGLAALGLLARFHVTTYGNTRIGNLFVYESVLFVCLGCMLYALSGQYIGWTRIKPLAYIGQISYSMYLVHRGILTLLSSHFSKLGTAAIGLILTIAYASLSWQFMERRLLQRNVTQSEAQSALLQSWS